MEKRILAAIALATAAVLPAACGNEAPEAAATEEVAVFNARLMLPPVSGNPGALYFDVTNNSDANRVIRAISIDGAGSAMLHYTDETGMHEANPLLVAPGETAKLEPGGNHVMAMDLADTVVAGSQAEVTLTFVGGKTMTFPAEVRAAGDER